MIVFGTCFVSYAFLYYKIILMVNIVSNKYKKKVTKLVKQIICLVVVCHPYWLLQM